MRSGAAPATAVLLLSEPGIVDAVRRLLQSRPGQSRVSHATILGDALVAMAGDPPALAVIDGALCEALEREFVDHLLQTHPGTQVLLLHGDTSEAWPPHPRLAHVAPQAVLAAVGKWLASRTESGETGA